MSPAMLNSIFIRFSKKRKFFNFDDFVFCLASLNLAVSMLDHMIYDVTVIIVYLLQLTTRSYRVVVK